MSERDYIVGLAEGKKRAVLLFEDIEKEVIEQVRKQIAKLSLENSEEQIYLLINTEGGAIEQSLWLVDQISMTSAPIIGVAVGACESSGVTILQGCDKRLATPNSRFFVHPPNGTYKYNLDSEATIREKFEFRLENSRNVWGRVRTLYERRSKLTAEEIEELASEGERLGYRFFADEAEELGFIDEVITPGDLQLF